MSTNTIIKVSCAVIVYQGKLLAAQRGQRKSNGGFWEFPGGKVEPGETPRECLHREIMEELGINITILGSLPSVLHQYPGKCIELIPFVCGYSGEKIVLIEHQKTAWISPEDLPMLQWSAADVKVWESYLPIHHRFIS